MAIKRAGNKNTIPARSPTSEKTGRVFVIAGILNESLIVINLSTLCVKIPFLLYKLKPVV